METAIRENGDIVIIDINGEIDLYHANDLRQQIKEFQETGKVKIIVNLKETPYIDSSGIGVLTSNLRALQKSGGDLKICHLQDPVQKIFEFSKLNTLFQIFETEEDAVNSW